MILNKLIREVILKSSSLGFIPLLVVGEIGKRMLKMLSVLREKAGNMTILCRLREVLEDLRVYVLGLCMRVISEQIS